MSWWIMPTTADIGIRAFSSSINGAIREVTLGMQSILLSEVGAKVCANLVCNSGEWGVKISNSNDNTMVSWLEEVLYQGEVEGRWLIDCQIMKITTANVTTFFTIQQEHNFTYVWY